MTRRWAPAIKAIQEALQAALEAERVAQQLDLPVGMRGANLKVSVAEDVGRKPATPFSIQVLPPENGSGTYLSTLQLTSTFTLRCYLRAAAVDEVGRLTAIRELQGLVLDGFQAAQTLGGLIIGPAEPAIDWRDLLPGEGELSQEIGVRVVVRQ
jgi:hypothetical protein